MRKTIITGLKTLLGVGGTVCISFSGTLYGSPEPSGDQGIQLTIPQQFQRYLDRAELLFEMNMYPEAAANLKRADNLVLNETPHTVEFDLLIARKTALWKKVAQHVPRP